MRRSLIATLAASVVVCVLLTSLASDAKAQAPKPATAADAAKVLDLAKLPLLDGAETPNERNLARLSYAAAAGIKPAFEFHRKQLAAQQWEELPGGYTTDEYASGTFARNGYKLSLSVSPSGMPGKVSVMLINHGNLDFDKLPAPADLKPLYAGPVSKMLVTETPVDQTVEACRKLWLAQGWQPYGKAGNTWSFKQNAVQLSATISSAPAQGGQTVVSLSSTLMSVELPAPADAEHLQYSDTPTQLAFDTPGSFDDVVAFYKSTLGKSGWQPTTESLIKIGFRHHLIFRNPAKDLLELELHTVDGKTRVLLKHQTAVEVAELEKRLDEQAKRKATPQPAAKLALELPSGAQNAEFSKSRVEFKLPTGKAKTVIDAWRKQFAQDGWQEAVTTADAMTGVIAFKKGNAMLDLLYVDPGFIPAEVTITARGVEFEKGAAKK